MDHGHEEAMRADFAQWQSLLDSTFPIETETDFERRVRADEIELRWLNGSHTEHWQYLDDAYQDWASRPQTMTGFLDGVAEDRGAGYFVRVTDIEYRSQCQARDLTAAERVRRPERPPRPRGR